MMGRSTIYRRHEARLLKSMEKADDPRPKVVRVLGGLPGFRTFISPYQAPESPPAGASDLRTQRPSSSTSTAAPLSSLNFAPDETVIQLQPRAVTNHTTTASPLSNPDVVLARPLYVMTTAGVLGAMAETFHGSTATTKKVASPFQNAKLAAMESSSTAVPLLQEHGGSFSFLKLRAALSSSSSNSPAFVPGASLIHATKSQLVAGASTASVLFGTKALADAYNKRVQHQDGNNGHNSTIMTPTSFTSSALAGALVATVSAAMQQDAAIRFLVHTAMRQQKPQSSLISKLVHEQFLARHVVGATLYFSSYEIIQSFLTAPSSSSISTFQAQQWSSESSPAAKFPMVAIAISGATAGALYQGILLYNTSTIVPTASGMMNMSLVPASTTVAPRLLPAMLRAAPIHALLFVGYEWVQKS